MALPRISARPAEFGDAITAAATRRMKAVVSFYEPAIPGKYDPVTDTEVGGTPRVGVLTSIARIQSYSVARESTELGKWETDVNVRLQIPLTSPMPFLRQGLEVVVHYGAKDPTLERIELTVLTAVNSSDAALRTVECVSTLADMGQAAPYPSSFIYPQAA